MNNSFYTSQVTDFSWSHDGRMALICYCDGFVLVGSVAGQMYWSSMLNLDQTTITCGVWSPDDQQVSSPPPPPPPPPPPFPLADLSLSLISLSFSCNLIQSPFYSFFVSFSISTATSTSSNPAAEDEVIWLAEGLAYPATLACGGNQVTRLVGGDRGHAHRTVSYTHLTLPTICSV